MVLLSLLTNTTAFCSTGVSFAILSNSNALFIAINGTLKIKASSLANTLLSEADTCIQIFEGFHQ